MEERCSVRPSKPVSFTKHVVCCVDATRDIQRSCNLNALSSENTGQIPLRALTLEQGYAAGFGEGAKGAREIRIKDKGLRLEQIGVLRRKEFGVATVETLSILNGGDAVNYCPRVPVSPWTFVLVSKMQSEPLFLNLRCQYISVLDP